MRIFVAGLSIWVSGCLLVNVVAYGAELAPDANQAGDIELGVSLDPAEQAGSARATVRIHALPEVVWSLITSCTEALTIVPGLIECRILETAPDNSWQTIRHVLNYSWFLPRLTYELRATYDRPLRVFIERTSGDLRTLKVSWTLRREGDYTIANYTVELAPGFWVPHWLVRVALKRDLPKMLRTLRSQAELVAHGS